MPQLTVFVPQSDDRARVPAARSTAPSNDGAGYSTATSFACFVGFREAREQLRAQFEPAAPAGAPVPGAQKNAAREPRVAGWVRPLETSFPWLICAAAFEWFLLTILSL